MGGDTKHSKKKNLAERGVSKDYVSLPITPMRAPRMTVRDRWTDVERGKGRPAVLRYFRYRDELRRALPDYELPTRLDITFLIPMPKSWSKKKRAAYAGSPHDQKPDIDNLAKAFLDAFHSEDKHVYSLTAEKYWAETGSIELRVAA